MGVTVVSYTLKDVRDEEVRFNITPEDWVSYFGLIDLEYTSILDNHSKISYQEFIMS